VRGKVTSSEGEVPRLPPLQIPPCPGHGFSVDMGAVSMFT